MNPKFKVGDRVIAVFSDKEIALGKIVDYYVGKIAGNYIYYAVDFEGQEISNLSMFNIYTAFGCFPAILESRLEEPWIMDTKLGKLL